MLNRINKRVRLFINKSFSRTKRKNKQREAQEARFEQIAMFPDLVPNRFMA